MDNKSKIRARMADAVAYSYYKKWYQRWWGKVAGILFILVIIGMIYLVALVISNVSHLNKGEIFDPQSGFWISAEKFEEGQKVFTDIVTEDDPWLGSNEPVVYVVVYESFGCPFCKESQVYIKQMLSKFGSIVRYIVKDFPTEGLHPGVFDAHLAAACAKEQGRYWDYADILFQNQGSFAKTDLKKYAKNIGLSEEQFNNCLDTEKYSQEIRQDYASGVQAGVVGTPSYIINDNLIPGVITYDIWEEMIGFIIKGEY
ncbi:MAG: hypothetical protein COV55_02070 [Candidatus Komeilibacteria bacterium CG11_big_fil_rev_8_21_14_0_20_36_20]|uniref:Thioredoxin domain-containing protein n=1 Tax=Candidatus Komeilibacteria bacterium CG11_big_fil_rev_8_21_14_0_20_36_20 TaxID=1974477 RepID=A0A2H0NDA2_9BACT|nr:MAG: hypothetical protein COV55_02070 [Candidatus Komeilibacteria bacterium CG11_big_fil_rev_8_21_14_0_20_36_20]PIR81583.1 MAG: hypothetical protein COU21_02880 [Candidatus Komeilibacteria bacterium CG10_big_fil_rev_8_21_14_0_10_36_65]PJC55421.1 MAG: hypothetical protein CO027_02180 [Candidatus Komeilibacteria bacterium CG_4_9_14_0_2_um_filter_36_13]